MGEFYVKARVNFEIHEGRTIRFVAGHYYQVDYADVETILVANGGVGATFSPEEVDDRFERHEGDFLSLFTKRADFRHAAHWLYGYVQRWCRTGDISERKWRAAFATAIAEMFVAAHDPQPNTPCAKWTLDLHTNGVPGKVLLRAVEMLKADRSLLETAMSSGNTFSLTFEDSKNISFAGTIKTSGSTRVGQPLV